MNQKRSDKLVKMVKIKNIQYEKKNKISLEHFRFA